MVEGVTGSDILGTLSDKAPGLVDQVDATLQNLNKLLGETGQLLSEPDSDIRQTLVSVQQSAGTLNDFLTSERARLSEIVANVESLTGNLDEFASENTDSLSVLINNVNSVMTRLDQNLQSLESVSTSLSEVLRKINEGEGTLGLFVNDPGVYQKMDSVLSSLDALLVEFRNNPDKFMKELRLVEIF